MANIVVGLFETRNDAQAVRSALEDLGLGQDTTTVVQRGEADLTSRLVDAGIPPADARLFAAGVSQGHHLIMTQSIADHDVAQAAAVMERHNVIAIRSRRPRAQRTSLERTAGDTVHGTAISAARPPTADAAQDLAVAINEQRAVDRAVADAGRASKHARIVAEMITRKDAQERKATLRDHVGRTPMEDDDLRA